MEQYLQIYVNFYQDDWVDWLLLAKFVANNQVSKTTEFNPFFTNYSFYFYIDIESVKSNPSI